MAQKNYSFGTIFALSYIRYCFAMEPILYINDFFAIMIIIFIELDDLTRFLKTC